MKTDDPSNLKKISKRSFTASLKSSFSVCFIILVPLGHFFTFLQSMLYIISVTYDQNTTHFPEETTGCQDIALGAEICCSLSGQHILTVILCCVSINYGPLFHKMLLRCSFVLRIKLHTPTQTKKPSVMQKYLCVPISLLCIQQHQ